MPYIYENVTTKAARALLGHPEFDARLRPLLDEMNDAMRRGEPGAPYLSAPVAVAKELYEGDPDQAILFVWCCAKESWAESYKSAVPTTVEHLRRGDVLVGKDGGLTRVLKVRLGADSHLGVGSRTTLRLFGWREYTTGAYSHRSEVRRLPREGEQTNA